jgi:flagellar basal-body rod modification protein FlgD
MTTIAGPTSTTTTPAPTTTTARTEETSSGTIAADFQTFLTLLTTQLKNQDPLSPTDSTEYMSQLASFSGVEQQVRSNDRLDTIIDALGGGSSAGLAAWIGRSVQAPVAAPYEGEPVEVAFTATDGADRAVLVVTNAFGSEVARRALAGDATEATWDGTDDLGAAVAHGDYTFTIEGYDADTLLDTTPGNVFTTVSEVRMADGETTLIVGDGQAIPLDSVVALR